MIIFNSLLFASDNTVGEIPSFNARWREISSSFLHEAVSLLPNREISECPNQTRHGITQYMSCSYSLLKLQTSARKSGTFQKDASPLTVQTPLASIPVGSAQISRNSQKSNRLRTFFIVSTLITGAAKLYSWSKPKQATK